MSNHKLIEAVTKSQLRTDCTGDVTSNVVVVGISETFTVRKISSGVGVERTFPLHTPKIEKSNLNVVVKYVAKLYYLRSLRGKAARIQEIR